MVQAVSATHTSWVRSGGVIVVVALGAAVLATVFNQSWLPGLRASLGFTAPNAAESYKKVSDGHAGHDHTGHDHGSGNANSIELSEQARKNIGLKVERVKLSSFVRSISIPGIVVERPGRSTILVSAPMTGIVTRIYPTEGESVAPGRPLFELRLTHEEIVQAQADLLRTSEELEVVAREIERLEKITADGAIAGKAMLERKYERQKLEAVHRAQGQALLLHGLSDKQIESIVKDRSLLKTITIRAPQPADTGSEKQEKPTFQIQSVKVAPGQHVNAGEALAVLVDYTSLLIEANAFESDAGLIEDAVRQKARVQAIIEREGVVGRQIDDLAILYQSSQVDTESRTTHFYVGLPNQAFEEKNSESDRNFLTWRYRPGQRMRLLVPIEVLSDRIVLPVTAIAQDGIESYVFTVNSDSFVRRPVHIEHRDDFSAVIANDGSVFVDDQVAMNGAQQLQLALKNKAGGGIDPHAGHNH